MTAKPKAQLMKETRQRRRDAGLVEFRAWVTVEQYDKLKQLNTHNGYRDMQIDERLAEQAEITKFEHDRLLSEVERLKLLNKELEEEYINYVKQMTDDITAANKEIEQLKKENLNFRKDFSKAYLKACDVEGISAPPFSHILRNLTNHKE